MKIKVIALLFISIILQASALFAQDGSGRIEGKITDAVTGEALIGVNVIIEGTSLGQATGLDGDYVIRGVKAGPQTILVSYIGFKKVEREVEVIAGETITVNIALEQETVEGEEVIVSAQAQGQRQAINEQLTSRSIKNVVSSERIRELPDESAAAALSRLPGISLEGGDKVVIRGVQAKQNVVMVNGVRLPSTDVNNRSTNLGFISSNMLSGIEVTKALTPEMDASAIGGTVNLRLKEADEGLHADVMLQGDYNTQDHTAENYQIWGSVSNRFFNNKLGAFLQVNARKVTGGGDIGSATFNRVGRFSETNKVYGEAVYSLDEFTYSDQVSITDEYGGSIILDYKLPNTKIVLQNTIAFRENDFVSHHDRLLLQNTVRRYRTSRDLNSNVLLINALQVEHEFGSGTLDLGVSRSISERRTDLSWGANADFNFKNPNFSQGDPSTHPFSDEYQNVDNRLYLTPYDVFDLSLNNQDPEVAAISELGETTDTDFDEKVYTGFLNYTIPVTFSDNFSGEFKTGGQIAHTYRWNDRTRYYARLSEVNNNDGAAEYMESIGADPNVRLQYNDWWDRGYLDDRGQYFLGGSYDMITAIDVDKMDRYFELSRSGWSPGLHDVDSWTNDYEGTETVTAGYFQADFNIGEKLSILTGARYEYYNMDFDANFVYVTHWVDGLGNNLDTLNTAQRSRGDWFPNFQAQYKATDWFDMRFAYTESISRPDYNTIIPRIYIDARNYGEAGNPNLEPTTSQNLDLYFTFHGNKLGLFTIGAFGKKLEDVSYGINRFYKQLPEGTFFPDSADYAWLEENQNIRPLYGTSNVNTTFNNPHPAYVGGLEFDWQTNFWYLPKPLNSLVLNVNYTRIFSEMDYPQVLVKDSVDNSGIFPQVINYQVDTLRTARLIQQGEHIFNLALGYDYKGFSGRISYRLQGNVMTGIGGRPEDDNFTGNIHNWDFTIRQKLPVDGMSLFFNGVNITHSPVKTYRRFKRGDPSQSVERNLASIAYYPRRFQLGFRYGF